MSSPYSHGLEPVTCLQYVMVPDAIAGSKDVVVFICLVPFHQALKIACSGLLAARTEGAAG